MSASPWNQRRAFLAGFFAMITLCVVGTVVFALTGHLRTSFHFFTHGSSVHKNAPPRPDPLEPARERLRRVAGKGADLAFPLVSPRLVVCKEYRELDLYSGERFIKRYRLIQAPAAATAPQPGASRAAALDDLPEGTLQVVTHDPTDNAAHLALGVGAAPAASASATATNPAPAPAAPNFIIHGPGGPAAGGIELTSLEMQELFAATAPGATVVIEK